MKFKCIPEDFIVEEQYNKTLFEQKNEGKNLYTYFILTKREYTQQKAIEKIARVFNTDYRQVYFAGTKDKVGITKQLICIYNLHKDWEKNVEYFNTNVQDLKLEYFGQYLGRIHLGDNFGNSFSIVVRDLTEQEIETAKHNYETDLKLNGFINYFDSQRFGYAGNTHIVGKYLLQKNSKLALFEFLTALPENASDKLRTKIAFLKENYEQLILGTCDYSSIEPLLTNDETRMLNYMRKHSNDTLGAIKILPKKLMTLFIHAYQSYIFNEIAKNLTLEEKKTLKTLPLVAQDLKGEGKIYDQIISILTKDNLSLDSFNITFMPEYQFQTIDRELKLFVSDLTFSGTTNDELHDGKFKCTIKFTLPSSAYATNIIKQLFE